MNKILIVLMTVVCVACADEVTPYNMKIMDMYATDQAADIQDMGVIEPPKKGENESCNTTSDCERTLGCNPVSKVCMYRDNCLVRWIFEEPTDVPADEGCIVDGVTAGQISAKECETDADCAGNPRSERCQFRICQDYKDCVKDEDCPAPQTCFGTTDRPITRVCVP